MIRYDLRAADAPSLDSALAALDAAMIVALDVIGTITVQTGEIDADGAPINQPIEGWHANLYTVEELSPAELEALPVIPTPATPWRMLAGEQADPPPED
ncbi:hypothetical protein [Rhizorhabdus histidinilytica]|uniref:hypothetical protein n=1 Tax=Rhizorhabdus histidinilytica TaxID=439228 RepID=UPI00321FEDF9